MKKVLTAIACCFMCVCLLGASSVKAAESKNKVASSILIDYNSGTVVSEHNADDKRPIASMVKIMTLLICFDNLESGKISLDDDVTISQNSASMGGSQAFLDSGSTYKADTLMKTIALSSANDSCVAMAEHISGNVSGFVDQMNKKAASLGMENTLFSNCTGLPAVGQYSTARDVSLMFRSLISHPKYFDYSTIWMEDLVHPSGRVTGLTNTNKLIKQYAGCDGGKTGFTNEAKHCLAATAVKGDTRLVSVVIAGESSSARFGATKEMFDYGFANYESKMLVREGEKIENTVKSLGTLEGNVCLVAKGNLAVFGEKNKLQYEVEVILPKTVKAPIKKGDTVGQLVAKNGDQEICKVDIVAGCDIVPATYFELVQKIISGK